jgi:segregation and condensation protein B
MTAAARRRRRSSEDVLDVELADLPPAARWREWMLRVEAAIFASARPVPREALVRLVGETCRFDDLIADLTHELRGRPYDLALVAGGYALRTKTRFAAAVRAAHPGLAGDDITELTRTETFALTAIAYLQPVTRGEISKLAGREISRDVIAALKRHGLIDGAIRAPQPGAPFAYVTTKTFLEAFGFASLRDLPDLERLKAERPLQSEQGENDLDSALGLGGVEDNGDLFPILQHAVQPLQIDHAKPGGSATQGDRFRGGHRGGRRRDARR